jgi:hypothetical protein
VGDATCPAGFERLTDALALIDATGKVQLLLEGCRSRPEMLLGANPDQVADYRFDADITKLFRTAPTTAMPRFGEISSYSDERNSHFTLQRRKRSE